MNDRIDNVIDRWFKETEAAFEKVHTDSPIDRVCCSVTAVGHNYCSAVLSLLNKEHRLPSMALLRVLAELALRLLWCLYSGNPQKESDDVRIKRWLKTSLLERKKHVKRMIERNVCSAKETNGFKKELETLEQMIKENGYKPIGRFIDSLCDLPDVYKKDIYPLLYGNFNWAVHPDVLLLNRLLRENCDFHIVVSDIDEDPTLLKIYCATLAFNILAVVRQNYKWDYNSIKTEYLKIKEDFSKERRA
jgi:hypothetical protein